MSKPNAFSRFLKALGDFFSFKFLRDRSKELSDLRRIKDEILTEREKTEQERKRCEFVQQRSQEILQNFTDMKIVDDGTIKNIINDVVRSMANSNLFSGGPSELIKVRCEGIVHKQMPLVIAGLQADIPIWLYGDAGSGKTTAAALASDMLGLEFRQISVCPTTTKSDFLGFIDAGGTYRRTAFRDIYENGGVYLIDEIDNGNPSTLALLNTALANNQCAFPDALVRRHKMTRIIASANTIGRGASTRFVGRNAIDATTLDRFIYIEMNIDEDMERAVINQSSVFKKPIKTKPIDLLDGGRLSVDDWYNLVLLARAACNEGGIEHLITPRATFYGRDLIRVGVGRNHLLNMCIFKGLPITDRTKIEAYMRQRNALGTVTPYTKNTRPPDA